MNNSNNKTWSLVFIFGSVIINQMALDLYTPSLPAMQAALHTSSSHIQFSMAIYLLGIFFSAFCFGSLSDYFGRRKMLIIAYSGFCLASALTLFADSITLLLIGRLAQGLSLGFCSGSGRGMARDVFKGKAFAKITSYSSITRSSTIIISPFIGGYIQQYLNWHVSFGLLLGLGLVLLITALFKCKETNTSQQPFAVKPIIRSYQSILSHQKFLGSMLCLICSYSIILLIIQMGPFIFQNDLQLQPATYGYIPLALGIIGIIGAQLYNTLLHKSKTLTLIKSAFIYVFTITTIAIALFKFGITGFWLTFIPLILIRLVGPWVFASAITISIQPFPKMAGTSGSLMNALIFLGGCCVSLLSSHLAQPSPLTLFICILILGICGLLSYFLLLSKPRQPQLETFLLDRQ